MGIIGRHPESGLRIDVARAHDGGPPWIYDGEAITPSAVFAMRAIVEADGAVVVTLADGAPGGAAEKARLIVRAAYKHSREARDEAAPPRRIQRWRADI